MYVYIFDGVKMFVQTDRRSLSLSGSTEIIITTWSWENSC